jgi:curved DNA-binding protein CbpA
MPTMVSMPRPPLPSDDLYARLGVPIDASVEAIELAWRGLLRRHHPDVAGDEGLEVAKRINVAHDWLADPALRARYDRERGLRHAVGPRGDERGGPWHARGSSSVRDEPDEARPAGRRRTADPAIAIAQFLERIASLTTTDIDRLALAEPPPIAFGATIRRFLPLVQRAALDDLEARIDAALPPAADRPAIRDAIDGFATDLVLGPFLDELLTEPFRSRARERLTRGWEAAVDRPRYGPNGPGVEAFLRRLRDLDAAGVAGLAATGVGLRGDEPWPGGLSPEDDDGLRVSSALAGLDAVAAIPMGPDGDPPPRARRAASRLAHLLVLRHAFAPASFADLTAPWRPWLIPPEAPPPRVRRPARSS